MVGEINEAVKRGPESSSEDSDAEEDTAALRRDRVRQREEMMMTTEPLVLLAGATRSRAPRRHFTDEARYRELQGRDFS